MNTTETNQDYTAWIPCSEHLPDEGVTVDGPVVVLPGYEHVRLLHADALEETGMTDPDLTTLLSLQREMILALAERLAVCSELLTRAAEREDRRRGTEEAEKRAMAVAFARE